MKFTFNNLIIFFLGVALAQQAIAKTPVFSIEKVGLYGDGYTGIYGIGKTEVTRLNNLGHAVGYSTRYKPGASHDSGSDAWFYNGASTVQIGLIGGIYTSSNGFALSGVNALNDSGIAVGSSRRMVGTDPSGLYGSDVWLYNGATTVQIGLTGEGFISTEGVANSRIGSLNNAGQVIGTTDRHIASCCGTTQQAGTVAWLYNGSSTIELGLAGSAYDFGSAYGYGSSFGYSTAQLLNEAGNVAGLSSRVKIDSGSIYGLEAWVFNGSSTQRIGLYGVGHNSQAGYVETEVRAINNSGKVVGNSNRYKKTSDDQFGQSAWIYNGNSTLRIGLISADYVNQDGTAWSQVLFISDTGHAAGNSHRYKVGNITGFGHEAWIYNGNSTMRLGFSGADFVDHNGFYNSTLIALNNSGYAIGNSRRYKSGDLGYWTTNAWYYDGSTHLEMGLKGEDFLDKYGNIYSEVKLINNAGQAAGSSKRFSKDQYNFHTGYSAWFFDANLNQFFDLTLSISSSGYGYASSEVNYLGEDGAVLGTYIEYDSAFGLENRRLFYFKVGDGLFDLGELVGDLSIDGWISLDGAIKANGIGNIIGFGSTPRPSGWGANSSAFILKPSEVPIPGTAWLFGTCLLGLIAKRRAELAVSH